MTDKPLIAFTYSLVGRGGDAVQVLSMAEALRRNGCEVALLGPQALSPYAQAGISASGRRLGKRLPWWMRDLVDAGFNLLSLLKALPFVLRRKPRAIFDRVTPYGFTGLALSLLTGVPLIAHIDAPFDVERSYQGQRLASGLSRWVLRRVAGRASVVIVGSKVARRYHEQAGLPPDRLFVVHNGVFASEVAPARQDLQARVVIGFAGSFARWHRVDMLVEAYHKLVQGLQEEAATELMLVGMGEGYGRAVEKVEAFGLLDHVRFTGPLPRQQVLELVDQFDIAVLPHTLATGSPMKLFEYAARGAAIVAPDLPNVREVFSPDEVVLFPPNDVDALAEALQRLVKDAPLRRALAHGARDRVASRYTWESQMGRALDRAGIASDRRGEG